MTISKEQLNIFREAFRKANDGTISLPKKVDFDKKTYIEFYTNGMRGGKSSKFIFRINQSEEPFLEFVSSNDFFSYHYLINKDGEIIELINTEREIGKVSYLDTIKYLKDGKSIFPANSIDNASTEKEQLNKKKELLTHINYWSGFKNLFK